MASVGVAFRNSSPLHGVLQESNNKSNKRDAVIILRKKPQPQEISVTSLISQSNNSAHAEPPRQKKPKKEPSNRVHNPPPIAVARRNARERNRVKQVNNGFATLRQHIPNEIAEIYENANNNRTANKKLSKVETLRMAVEYIRSLENLLQFDENRDMSLASFPSPASSESLQNNSSFEQGYFSIQSPVLEDEIESNPSTPLPSVAPHRFARIPGTNAFQLIRGHTAGYEDEENVHPLTPNSDLLPQEDVAIHGHIEYVQTIPQFTVIHPNMLSSPNFYSDSSLSPNVEYIQSIYQPPQLIMNPAITTTTELKTEKFSPVMKTEDEATFRQEDPEEDEDMNEVMTWWETEGKHEDESS